MRVNLNDILELIKQIEKNLGIYSAYLFIGLLIFSILLFIYLKYSLKTLAEETSKKSVAQFKSELDKSIQTQMGLFFRDESIRNELITTIGQKSFDKKIECWQLVHSIYFDYQKSWIFDQDTDIEEYKEIDEKLNQARRKIFNETVYLGYELTQKLIRLSSLMRNGLRDKRTEFIYSGRNYQSINEAKLQANLSLQQDTENKITELLYETESWIIMKLHSDQTLEKFEFSKEQLQKIQKEREKQFEAI